MKSREQMRAAHAYAAIAAAPGERSVAEELPFMLAKNGLLATLAHLLSKNRSQPPLAAPLIEHLRRFPELQVPDGTPEAVFLHWVGSAAGDDGVKGPVLRDLTAEAVAYAVWLKRAAKAHLEMPSQEESR